MAVLYRKYRPQTFAEVLGQRHVVQTLKNQVIAGSVAHAYLFTGSRGVGKTSVARILAKAVNCRKVKDGEPDGICDICQQIASNNFIDLVEIDAASNTGVDNIRELIEHVKFSPSIGKYKVFIIDEVHMLSKGAFNALLKTLEEPPKHVIFILATTEINKVPPTIISRTQKFDFTLPSLIELTDHLHKVVKLEKVTIDSEIIEVIASHASGGVRDALSLLDKVMSLGDNPSVEDCLRLLGVTDASLSVELLTIIVSQDSSRVMPFFESLLERGVDFAIFNRDFLEYLRKVLMVKITPSMVGNGLTSEQQTQLKVLTEDISLQEVILIIRLFLKSYKDLPAAPSADIPLILAALEGCLRKQSIAPQPKISSPNQANGAAMAKAPVPAPPQPKPLHPPVVESAVSSFAFTHVLEPSVGAPVVPEVVEIIEADESVGLMDIQPKWEEIIRAIKSVNSPLGNLVKSSPLQKVEKGRVYVGVKFLFHKQNLENQKNLKIICGAIEQVTGKTVGLCAQIVKDVEIERVEPAEVLNDALRILGGELVE